MAQHAPGPFRLHDKTATVLRPDGTALAHFFHGGEAIDLEDARRDALMLIAAPDLLLACELFLDAVDKGGQPLFAAAQTRAAVAKARGEQVSP